MDNNFDWLEEEKKTEKEKLPVPQWVREYWMHIAALVVIFGVLIFLILNPASKSVTHENTITLTTPAAQSQNKQIIIRMPDKTTKLANTEPATQKSSAPKKPIVATAPTLKPAEPLRNAELRLPIKQIGIIQPQNSAANAKNPTANSTAQNSTATKINNTPKKLIPAPQSPEAPTLAPAPIEGTTPIEPVTEPITQTMAQKPAVSSTTTTATNAQKPKVPATTAAPTTSPAVTPPATPPKEIQQVAPENADLGILLSRAPSHYILQLFGSHSEAAAKSFIAQNNLSGQALYAKVWQNNQDWYVVLYGDYADRNQATAALNQLAPNLRAQNPWARSMQSVQDSIRQRLVRGK